MLPAAPAGRKQWPGQGFWWIAQHGAESPRVAQAQKAAWLSRAKAASTSRAWNPPPLLPMPGIQSVALILKPPLKSIFLCSPFLFKGSEERGQLSSHPTFVDRLPCKMPETPFKCSGGFALHCHAEEAFFQLPRWRNGNLEMDLKKLNQKLSGKILGKKHGVWSREFNITTLSSSHDNEDFF